MNTGFSRPGGAAISIRAGRDVREEVGTLIFTPASLFVALVLPMVPAHRTISRLRKECRTPLENPCNSSSLASSAVLFPIPMGFST
jgi:hypothetical protein